MIKDEFTYTDPTGTEIFVYAWSPDSPEDIQGVVQISHGMAETAARYERFARVLNDAGYIVYANDHRGHGKSAKSLDDVGYIGDDGFNWMVKNMAELNEIVRERHPDLPVFLFGHSMGSFLAQQYIALYGDSLKGAILSGSGGNPGAVINLGIYLAKRELKRNGDRFRSVTLSKMTFGPYNKGFSPARTDFDWLSRDTAEVDAYINDPYCGGIFTANFYYHFYKGLRDTFKNRMAERVPKKLPIYIFSGDKDPVGKNGKGVEQLLQIYQRAGINDVTLKLYPNGRHEMLNETNRDEVMADVVTWIDKRV
ncbi:alpha/beta hydrolase [Alicyclobacillus ferrooxydans]|uniref:Alpha/beta hydrolase n=1 Tax=Alicyclobacillus ferrooxydans TaxID=471514 RepID=A0A0P9CJ87_9BACL|nr:alpha/beta hydrolase [Alicyclobacillus ferrooxydans]KPV43072.1 alpha/beta hydrolase [Alicyclobacillus ferrooxydans]